MRDNELNRRITVRGQQRDTPGTFKNTKSLIGQRCLKDAFPALLPRQKARGGSRQLPSDATQRSLMGQSKKEEILFTEVSF